jgi:hypothetical protein
VSLDATSGAGLCLKLTDMDLVMTRSSDAGCVACKDAREACSEACSAVAGDHSCETETVGFLVGRSVEGHVVAFGIDWKRLMRM